MQKKGFLVLNYSPYFDHFSIPFFHSCIKPIIKIAVVIVLDINHSCRFTIFVSVIGSIIEISMSKIKNSVPIRKKWIENGFRGEDIGENPHSNGEFFSRLIFVFFDKMVVIKKVIFMIITIINVVDKINIIFLKF